MFLRVQAHTYACNSLVYKSHIIFSWFSYVVRATKANQNATNLGGGFPFASHCITIFSRGSTM